MSPRLILCLRAEKLRHRASLRATLRTTCEKQPLGEPRSPRSSGQWERPVPQVETWGRFFRGSGLQNTQQCFLGEVWLRGTGNKDLRKFPQAFWPRNLSRSVKQWQVERKVWKTWLPPPHKSCSTASGGEEMATPSKRRRWLKGHEFLVFQRWFTMLMVDVGPNPWFTSQSLLL